MGAATLTSTFVENVRARRWRAFDLQLLLYVLLLIALGVVMGYSAGYSESGISSGMSQTVRTLIWAAIGLIIFFVAASVDYHWLQTLSLPIYLVVLGLLTLTMLVGTNLFGAQMSITVAGLDFQFSEVSKVLMITVLASFLSGRREKIGAPVDDLRRRPDHGHPDLPGLPAAGPRDRARLRGDPGRHAVPERRQHRLDGHLRRRDTWQRRRSSCSRCRTISANASSASWIHRRIRRAPATSWSRRSTPWDRAACFGQGLTAGRQNQLGFLPVQSTDFIFTVIAEELGFVGGLLVLVIVGLLIWRILAIGWGARDALGAMIAVGLASMLLFQVIVNVGMVIGIMPVTGIPLPFITYGGSSLISLLFGMGILQSVRMHSRKPTF